MAQVCPALSLPTTDVALLLRVGRLFWTLVPVPTKLSTKIVPQASHFFLLTTARTITSFSVRSTTSPPPSSSSPTYSDLPSHLFLLYLHQPELVTTQLTARPRRAPQPGRNRLPVREHRSSCIGTQRFSLPCPPSPPPTLSRFA